MVDRVAASFFSEHERDCNVQESEYGEANPDQCCKESNRRGRDREDHDAAGKTDEAARHDPGAPLEGLAGEPDEEITDSLGDHHDPSDEREECLCEIRVAD